MSKNQTLAQTYLNCAPGFWNTYAMEPGHVRRQALLAIFHQYPQAMLPVNLKWQANLIDPDLRYLLKKGVLRRVRDGGGPRKGSPRTALQKQLNPASLKRQTYLILGAVARGAQ